MTALADPDTRLWGGLNADIRLAGPIKYVSQYLTYISKLEGTIVYSQTLWKDHGRIFSLSIRHCVTE